MPFPDRDPTSEQARRGLKFVAFLVIRLWQDPAGSGHATVNFVGSIGSFFSSAVDKLSQFVRSLGK